MIRRFAGEILREGLAVDALLHNAGVLTLGKTRSTSICPARPAPPPGSMTTIRAARAIIMLDAPTGIRSSR